MRGGVGFGRPCDAAGATTVLGVARPALFTDDDVLDAALDVVGREGDRATVADVSKALGGPVGSIYHRFSSRDLLIARLWLRSIARFQAGLFEIRDEAVRTGRSADDTLVQMAGHVPRYCREHQAEARALTLHRQDRLLADGPAELRDAVADLNTRAEAMTKELAVQRFGEGSRRGLALTVLAVRITPYGMVRPYAGGPVPHLVDEAVEAACRAILAIGDRS